MSQKKIVFMKIIHAVLLTNGLKMKCLMRTQAFNKATQVSQLMEPSSSSQNSRRKKKISRILIVLIFLKTNIFFDVYFASLLIWILFYIQEMIKYLLTNLNQRVFEANKHTFGTCPIILHKYAPSLLLKNRSNLLIKNIWITIDIFQCFDF